mmetsp:Transcript_59582/g.158524  ORF Transcript_59582/g.158524 Transcript_59582/m.158524 type:complete len:137 (-) Transcript_59582:85-495(-)
MIVATSDAMCHEGGCLCVFIDRALKVGKAKVVTYKLLVALDGRRWTVWRRYSEFRDLHESLKHSSAKLPRFPSLSIPLIFIGGSASLGRVAQFQAYLCEVLAVQESLGEEEDTLLKFLCINREAEKDTLLKPAQAL